MKFKPGDRFVVVDCEWLEPCGVEGEVTDVSEDGVVCQVLMDEPCMDIGKYRLYREGEIWVEYMERIDS